MKFKSYSLPLTWKNGLIWWERWYPEDIYHLRASSSRVSILCSVDKLLDHLRGMDAFINMALQFELSSARSPIFNIPRTSRCWWHRNEISDNYRWFYGVSGNPNDILSMTRRFGLKQSRFYDLEKCYLLEKQKSLPMSLARQSYAKKIWMTPWTKNSHFRVDQLDLSIWSH